mgnify:CR=1 FL=1
MASTPCGTWPPEVVAATQVAVTVAATVATVAAVEAGLAATVATVATVEAALAVAAMEAAVRKWAWPICPQDLKSKARR